MLHILHCFFFNDTATTEIYTVMNTLSLHDALPIPFNTSRTRSWLAYGALGLACSTRSEEHTSELQSLITISYAVFCLKKKKPVLVLDQKQVYQRSFSHSIILKRY